ncbi:hypothetical protein B0H66DRAFT_568988 [Apodospora peruviana]|uniref:Uncharacterized protein n=1 Tax=Apodospora peruviana TaxID=516989 RepID=A0AAE0LYR3_9PEZI|nr:hypothetical protein B0H66DRAFT_568988 [Apodospora peruviana]
MKLSLPLLIAPLLASPWGTAGHTTTGCNADNCLRGLRNPTRGAAATSFCHSYTQANVTATTALPTAFATPCGSGPTLSSRLSSACSCYVPPAPPACGDTSSDSNNCGTCGNVCVAGSTCSSGACVCTNSGKPPCNGQCLDLTSDNNNCGTCGHSCSSGTTCQSGACAPLPGGNCSSYTASCSDVINGILATNSIASPQLVDYRMQTAILGITSPSAFLAALGPNPCQIYTDATEHATCVALLANSAFVSELTDITVGVLTAFQTCASDFATGGPDYPVVINEPTCPSSVRRHAKRVGEDHDLTQSMLEGIEHYTMTAPAPVLGQMKQPLPDLIQLARRQASTCARTGQCFERCPDCRDQQTYCGSSAAAITTNVCGGVGAVVGAGVGALAAGACGTACGPGALVCAGFCAAAAGGLAGTAATAVCTAVSSRICTPLTEKCANCNSANSGICNADSTQCCAGETGTQCGAGCCCCPRCQAPGGINCACTAAAC